MARRKKGKPNHGITTEVAEKAVAAQFKPEYVYSRKLRRKNPKMLILNRSGVPDIIAYNKNWKFYEVKPHRKKPIGMGWRKAADEDRLLNPDQKKSFKEMLEKGKDVTMVYYYRTELGKKDRYGHPLYRFTFKTVSLKKSDFKRGKTVDPEIFEVEDRLISV